MKTILVIMMFATLSLGASAQRKGYYHYHAPYTRVYISPFSYGFGYPYFGIPNYGYPNYGYRSMPYNLSLQIEDINMDYKDKIRAKRRDKTLKHSQRRQEIRNLKSERDRAIIDAKMNYRRPRINNENPGMNNNRNFNNNQNPGNNSNNNSSFQGNS